MIPESPAEPIRVIVVDDSLTVRNMLVALLETAGGIRVVGVGANGEEAVRLAGRLRPDVITMDIRMPKLDGLEATRQIMRDCPVPIVIVSGSLMRDDVDLALESLRAGALTVINKPGLADPETCARVIQAVRLMAKVPVIHHWRQGKTHPPIKPAQPIKRPLYAGDVKVIGIASSTGGPAALVTILRSLPAEFPLPIVIVQHMSNGFITGLAEWLGRETALRIGVAGHGDALLPGTVLLAPDDYHLQINRQAVVELCKEAPYKGLRPSANYLFQSLARAYGPQAVGVILTGMGDDGVDGLVDLHQAGGLTFAQDEASCVVYGMPREAVVREAIDQILPLDQIAGALCQLLSPQLQPASL
jgi:two-component system chemotaxis response regulator CheB